MTMGESFGSLRPYFDGSDYPYWKLRMQAFLDSDQIDVWDQILVEWTPPTTTVGDVTTDLERKDWVDAHKKSNGKNQRAMSLLLASLSREECARVQHCTTAHSIWKTLANYHEGTTEVKNKRIELLVYQYETFKRMADENVTTLTNRLLALVEGLRKLGKIYNPGEVNKKILRSLPRKKFGAKITSIEESKDLTTMRTDELIGSLLIYEMNLDEDEKLEASEAKKDEKKKSLALKSTQEQDDEPKRDEAKGGPSEEQLVMLSKRVFKMMKARGDSSKGKRRSKEVKKSGSSIKCYECGKKGHIKPECPNLKGKTKKSFSAGWDEDNEDLSSSQQGDESESESEDEAANLAFMALDDSPNEVCISHLSSFSSSISNCESDDDDEDDPIQLIKELNSQCTRLHCERVEAQKLCEASNREVNELKAQVEALKLSQGELKGQLLASQFKISSMETLEKENDSLKSEVEELRESIAKFHKGKENLDTLLVSQRPPFVRHGL